MEPSVVLYVSSMAATTRMKYRQERMRFILQAKNIAYTEVDVAQDPYGKQEMLAASGGVKDLPQLHSNGVYIGDYDAVQELVDFQELEMVLEGKDPASNINEESASETGLDHTAQGGDMSAVEEQKRPSLQTEQPGSDMEQYPNEASFAERGGLAVPALPDTMESASEAVDAVISDLVWDCVEAAEMATNDDALEPGGSVLSSGVMLLGPCAALHVSRYSESSPGTGEGFGAEESDAGALQAAEEISFAYRRDCSSGGESRSPSLEEGEDEREEEEAAGGCADEGTLLDLETEVKLFGGGSHAAAGALSLRGSRYGDGSDGGDSPVVPWHAPAPAEGRAAPESAPNAASLYATPIESEASEAPDYQSVGDLGDGEEEGEGSEGADAEAIPYSEWLKHSGLSLESSSEDGDEGSLSGGDGLPLASAEAGDKPIPFSEWLRSQGSGGGSSSGGSSGEDEALEQSSPEKAIPFSDWLRAQR